MASRIVPTVLQGKKFVFGISYPTQSPVFGTLTNVQIYLNDLSDKKIKEYVTPKGNIVVQQYEVAQATTNDVLKGQIIDQIDVAVWSVPKSLWLV